MRASYSDFPRIIVQSCPPKFACRNSISRRLRQALQHHHSSKRSFRNCSMKLMSIDGWLRSETLWRTKIWNSRESFFVAATPSVCVKPFNSMASRIPITLAITLQIILPNSSVATACKLNLIRFCIGDRELARDWWANTPCGMLSRLCPAKAQTKIAFI